MESMTAKRKLTSLRDAELLHDYREKLREAMKNGEEINRRKIIRAVLTECSPHYYLSFDQANNMMSRISTHGFTNNRLSLKQQMWLEIFEKMQKEMERHPYLARHAALARVLLNGRASRYFISETYAYHRLYGIQKFARRAKCIRLRA